MSIIFSEHAIHQIKERNISKKLIIKSLEFPDIEITQINKRRKASKLFTKNKKPYCLVIVYEQNQFNKKIITAFITSKIKKYINI